MPDRRRPLRRAWRSAPLKRALVTTSKDDARLFEAIKSGAQGHLLKNLTAAEFFRLAREEPALSPGMARRLLSEVCPSADNRGVGPSGSEPLTVREQEVLLLMVQGVTTTQELARQLIVTHNTVKFHLRNILDKLHLHNRAEVVAYAGRHSVDSGQREGAPS